MRMQGIKVLDRVLETAQVQWLVVLVEDRNGEHTFFFTDQLPG